MTERFSDTNLCSVQAKPVEGGAGALLVLLQGSNGGFQNKNKP